MTASADGPSPALAPPPRREGALERAVGVVIAPMATLRSLAVERPVGQAVLVSLLGSSITIAVAFVPAARESESGAAWIVGGALLGLLFGLPIVAAWVGLCHIAARVLGQQGSYGGLFAAVGFTNALAVFQAPLALIGTVGGFAGAAVSGFWSAAFLAWVLVLQVLAIRANYRTGVGMAIATIFLAIIGALVAAVLLVVSVVVLVLLGLLAALR